MRSTNWRFARFELLTRERLLRADGVVLPLGSRAFDLLTVLVERAGRLVTKAELLDQVWPGLVVEENNIAAQITALRRVLGAELIETVPGHGYRFTVAATGMDASPLANPALVALGGCQLFGREDDLARLLRAMQQAGCVTLLGPAGVGKTALAQALRDAHDLSLDSRAARALWLDLGALSEPGQLLPALARALELHGPASDAALLAPALGARRLLIMDNAEHLLPATAELAALLLAAEPSLRLLVTSQAPLPLAGGREQRLEPLEIAGADTAADQALRSGAIGLLAARACAADYRLRLGAEQLPLLRALCSQLDGLPLALEMAAARVPLLGLQGVHDALAERFALLKRGHRGSLARHPTLQAALHWSHGLLAPAEQRLFRQLGVFSGGFSLELLMAATDTAESARWSLVDGLAALVDRSLVVAELAATESAPRYRLLETMRLYALTLLDEAGEAEAARRGHARALCQLMQRLRQQQDQADGAANPRINALCFAELDNARSALRWAMQHEPDSALALATCVGMLTTFSAWRGEAYGWVADCEALLGQRLSAATEADWWREFARQLVMRGSPRASEAATRACAQLRALGALGDERDLLRALVSLVRAAPSASPEVDRALAEITALLGRHPEWSARLRLVAAAARGSYHLKCGQLEAALGDHREELALAQALAWQDAADVAESNVLALIFLLERHAEAAALARAMLARPSVQAGASSAYVQCYLLAALIAQGQCDAALQACGPALQLARRFDVPYALTQLPLLAWALQRPQAAAQLLGLARQHFEQRQARPYGWIEQQWAALQAQLQGALGPGLAQALMQQGSQLSDTDAERLLAAFS